MSDLAIYEPGNLEQAMHLANTLCKSQLLPRALIGKPADVLLIMIKGRELGLSTMQSLSGLNVIQGKVVAEAATIVGLILSKPEICEYFTLVKSDDKIATYRTKRRNADPVEMGFTIEEAQAAKLTGKDNWRNFPAAMLRARASAALGRAVYPDLVAGIYVPGEIQDDARHHPAQESVAAPGVVRAATKAQSVDLAPVAAADVVNDVPRVVVEPDEVAPPAPVSNSVPEFQRPEFDDDSPEQKQHLREHAWEMATFTSGPLKNQYMEAASVADLEMYIGKLQAIIDGGRNTLPNLNALDAMAAWLRRKKADAQTWAETSVK